MDSARVLLIHGTAPATWGDLPHRLAPLRAETYVRRGFDGGPPARDLTEHAHDAAERLDGTSAIVIGWSIGGVIALELAVRHPDRVRGLVLLEPPFRAKRHPRFSMLSAIVGATVLGKRGRPDAGAQRFLRWALSRRDGTNDLDRLDPAALHCSAPAIVGELAAGTGEHLDRRELAALTLPITIVTGTESNPAFSAAARRLTGLIPHARLVTAKASGHALQLDAVDLVAEQARGLVPSPAGSRD